MSRFVSDKTRRITLKNSDGSQSEDWVDIRERFSFQHVIDSSGEDGLKAGLQLLEKAIVAWNLKDESGIDAPVTKENILRLDMDTVGELIKEVNASINVNDKKKGKESLTLDLQ